jgi:hypothetical protein
MRSGLERVAGTILLVFLIAAWIFGCGYVLMSTLRDKPDPTSFDWAAKQICGGVLFVMMGVFALAAEHSRWGWWVNHHKRRRSVRLFGETGARIFGIVIGLSTLALGILMLAAIIF